MRRFCPAHDTVVPLVSMVPGRNGNQAVASLIRANAKRLYETMELQTYRVNPSHPDHVQRSRPKARFSVEMPASMPARKFRSFLYTQLLLAISETVERERLHP
jgi:hypothetical protein